MSEHRALVLGASGFLGSHVVKALVDAGRPVRILVRESSNTSMTDHLDIERHTGDIFDPETLRRAMADCDTLFYCVVDTRSWLRDSALLYRTNVDGSRIVMELALEAGIGRFIFTSSIVTIGLNPSGISSEADLFNWEDQAPPYVMTRVKAEQQLLEFCARGLPGIACNVATTFGGHDNQPTPHGTLLKLTVEGKMPFYWPTKMSIVGIVDAAQGLLSAERHGRVGERYIIAERMIDMEETTRETAIHAGVRPPSIKMPMWVIVVGTWVIEKIMGLLNKDSVVTMDSITLQRIMGDYDNHKAKAELHWHPRPINESLKEAAAWFKDNAKKPS